MNYYIVSYSIVDESKRVIDKRMAEVRIAWKLEAYEDFLKLRAMLLESWKKERQNNNVDLNCIVDFSRPMQVKSESEVA